MLETQRKQTFSDLFSVVDGHPKHKHVKPSGQGTHTDTPMPSTTEAHNDTDTGQTGSHNGTTSTDLNYHQTGSQAGHGPPCDVAFICSNHKYRYFLNALLKLRAPDVITNFELTNETEELHSLENAKVVIALLSPDFVHSGKVVDDLHIALARHRKTVGRPLLYPIHVMELPRWPTYFHILPCRIALYDLIWKDMAYDFDHMYSDIAFHPELSDDINIANQRLYKDTKQRIIAEHQVALCAACDDIIFILQNIAR